jgi:outer membrane immunogenic protein
MKKTVLAAAFVMLSAPAFAADLAPFHSQNIVVPVSGYDWTGFYVGVNAGGGFGGNASGQIGPIALQGTASGFVGGGTVGYNYQIGRFVIGAEGDFDWSNIGNNTKIGLGPLALGIKAQENWLATARARIGWTPWDTSLIYVTGGAAFTNVTAGVSTPFGGINQSRTHTGWTVGAGFETALGHSNWTVKAEYLYTRFGSEKYFANFIPGGAKVKLDSHIIRVGLNYRF